MSSISQSQITSGKEHSKSDDTLKQKTMPMMNSVENPTKSSDVISQMASDRGTIDRNRPTRPSEANASLPFRMVDAIYPQWLGTLPIGQARSIVNAHAQEGCDSRETELREKLLSIRERREEIHNRTLEVNFSISESENKLRSRRTRFSLSNLRGTPHKNEHQLKDMRQEKAELERQWETLDNDLTTLDHSARALAETLLDQKVDQQLRPMAELLSQAKFESIDPTLQSIDGLRESVDEAYSTYVENEWELRGEIRRFARELVHHQGERPEIKTDPSEDVPLSIRLSCLPLQAHVTREYHSSMLRIDASTSCGQPLIEEVQHWVYDRPLNNEGVLKALREKGFDARVHRISSTEGGGSPQKGSLRRGSRDAEGGGRSVTFDDEITVNVLDEEPF